MISNTLISKQAAAFKAKDWASVIHYIDERLRSEKNANTDALLDERLEAMKRYEALKNVQLIA